MSDATLASLVTDLEYRMLQCFATRVDAKVGLKQWRQTYNEVRPHSSLIYLIPMEFKVTCVAGRDGGRSPTWSAQDQRRLW